MYVKIINNGIITSLCEVPTNIGLINNAVSISENEYVVLVDKLNNKPNDTSETIWVLDNELQEYVEMERPSDMPYIEQEEPNNDYGIPNEIYDSIIDEYTLMLIEEGVIE